VTLHFNINRFEKNKSPLRSSYNIVKTSNQQRMAKYKRNSEIVQRWRQKTVTLLNFHVQYVKNGIDNLEPQLLYVVTHPLLMFSNQNLSASLMRINCSRITLVNREPMLSGVASSRPAGYGSIFSKLLLYTARSRLIACKQTRKLTKSRQRK